MKFKHLFLVASVFVAIAIATGCSTPQKTAYESVSATVVVVEEAVKAYDVFAAAGKTTVAQNQQVAAAYAKYQAAMTVVIDAGAVYSATSATNAPAAQLALTQAEADFTTEASDLENLIRSFGVTF
jgi:hypothetical protein